MTGYSSRPASVSQAAMDCGELSAQPVEPVAHFLVVARATDQAAATVFMAVSLHRLLDGLRPAGTVVTSV
jgi:hypothetical protein